LLKKSYGDNQQKIPSGYIGATCIQRTRWSAENFSQKDTGNHKQQPKGCFKILSGKIASSVHIGDGDERRAVMTSIIVDKISNIV